MYKTKKSQRISVSDTKPQVGYGQRERWKLRKPKVSKASNANNTKRSIRMKGTVRFTNIPKWNQKFCKVLTKMVVVPDNKTTRQTIPNDSNQFLTIQGPRPAIPYNSNDSRPKDSDSIQFQQFKTQGQRFYSFQRFNMIQEPRSDDFIQSKTLVIFHPYKLMLVGVRRLTKSFPWCKLGSLVGGNSVLNPRNTSTYLYNTRYDYDNERIK
jgi:hypothetical protein